MNAQNPPCGCDKHPPLPPSVLAAARRAPAPEPAGLLDGTGSVNDPLRIALEV